VATRITEARRRHATNGCFEGNYCDYSKDFHKQKGVDADRPHRIAYKKLVRA
jgi:hypothetical protein